MFVAGMKECTLSMKWERNKVNSGLFLDGGIADDFFSFWLSGFSNFSISKMHYFCDGETAFLGKDGKLSLPIKFFFFSLETPSNCSKEA